ncbi:MAG: 4a-hydroxytetrahydrobiopterin dehydratase [Planctomycetota bacterium]|nr:MAG: 4a-hydroxytetrahydrobiopterin dehydratase [Planctomycetota bacterium]
MPIDPPLFEQHCKPLGPEHALDRAAADALLARLDAGWRIEADAHGVAQLARDFRFPDFYRTLSFVNALAHVANAQDHHPELVVGYGRCAVRWSTHSAHGLTLNDFVCAARVERLPR